MSKASQVGIPLKERVAREPIFGRNLQPLDCLLFIFQERISTGDMIGRMMEVAKPLPPLYGQLYLFLRLAFVR